MSISKDPMGLETIGPALGGEPSWDPEIRQRQQTFLIGVGSDRNLQDEHWSRLHGIPTRSSQASPADVAGTGNALALLLGLFVLVAIPLPVLFPPGFAGWMAWHFAAWQGWHALFAGLAGLTVFAIVLVLWTAVIVSVPRIFWTLSGLVLGAGAALGVASSARLDAVWTFVAVLCGAAVVAGWFWGLWSFLAAKFGAEMRRPSRGAVALSVGQLVIPFAIFGAGIAYAATLPYRIQDRGFESYMAFEAIASCVVFVLAMVGYLRNLIKGELVAAAFDSFTVLASAFLIFFAEPVRLAGWLGYPSQKIEAARFIVMNLAPTLLGWLAVALAIGFTARRWVVRKRVR